MIIIIINLREIKRIYIYIYRVYVGCATLIMASNLVSIGSPCIDPIAKQQGEDSGSRRDLSP